MEKYYNYLNGLRDSGKVNMFGASAYLEKRFKLKKNEAEKVLLRWMMEEGEK